MLFYVYCFCKNLWLFMFLKGNSEDVLEDCFLGF